MGPHESLNTKCVTRNKHEQTHIFACKLRLSQTIQFIVVSIILLKNHLPPVVKAFSVVPTTCSHPTKASMSLSVGTSIETKNNMKSKEQSQQENRNQVDNFWNDGQSSNSMKVLQNHQKVSSNIVKSFVPSEAFDPLQPLSNKHVQTIGGYFAREFFPELKYVKKNDWLLSFVQAMDINIRRQLQQQEQQFKDQEPPFPNKNKKHRKHDNNVGECPSYFWEERERIETPDGDWFHADYKYADNNGQVKHEVEETSLRSRCGLVILLHGFESNSESPLTKEMANGYVKLGMDVVCLNFRGCSGTPNDTLLGYHLGFTDDLRYFLSLVKSRHLRSSVQNMPPIYLSAFSFGSNVVLKALGELGEFAIDEYNIQGAALASAPLDLTLNQVVLEAPGFTRQVYANNMLKLLKARAEYSFDAFCHGDENTDKFDYPRAMAATTISELEDAYVAPIYGFDSYLDYYRKSSSIFYLDGIAVPTLIVNAKDDPFFDPMVWPTEKSCEGGGTAPIKMIHSENGGHLGFLFHQIEDEDELLNLQLDPLSPSWCSAECARFIKHAHSALSSVR